MVPRRKSIPVNVGGVVIGGAAPIAVQTMTKTDTRDVKATLRQIHELKDAGCEIVRPAVPDHEAAEALKEIVKGSPLPVIADIHYDHTLALLSVALGVTNLLPLLALDGGRIVVVIIEWLRRRPFDRNSELNFQRLGLVALIALAAVISFLDIQRIATGQFLGVH